jgi:hypothetical protein
LERFEGNHGQAALLGLSGVLMLAGIPIVLILAAPEFSTLTLLSVAALVFCLGGCGAAGVFLLHGAREASASYVVDDEGITRCAWGRMIVLAWGDLVQVEDYGGSGSKGQAGPSGRCVLHGVDGQRVAITYSCVANAQGLLDRLEPHLVAMRQKQLLSLARHGGKFRPGWRSGMMVLTCMAPLFLIDSLPLLFSVGPGSSDIPLNQKCVGFLFVAAGPVLALLGLELVSRKLTVTADGLALQSLFLNRSISFMQVESIVVKVLGSGEPITERAKIQGDDGRSITIDSSMTGYRAVLDLLRRRCGAKRCGVPGNDPEFS